MAKTKTQASDGFDGFPRELFLDVGPWYPEPAALAAIRARITEAPAAWKKASSGGPFTSTFRLEGESLKRPPRGVDPEHPCVDDRERKDHIAVADLQIAALGKPGAPDEVVAAMLVAKPYLRFLCEALQLPF